MSAELECELAALSDEVIDPDLTCTITLGNWPADTAPASELALFEGYKATMAKQYPNVTLVPDYFSYTLSNYVPMAKGGTAPSIFQPPFTDPQLLISQNLVGDVTDALAACGALDKFSPSYIEMLADENGRIYGLPRDGYVLGMHLNVALFREAGLVTEDGLPMIPTTLQEVAEYGQIIREKTGKAGLVFPASETAAPRCCPRSAPGTTRSTTPPSRPSSTSTATSICVCTTISSTPSPRAPSRCARRSPSLPSSSTAS